MASAGLDRMDTEEAERRNVDPAAQREIDQFKMSMQQSRMQTSRMHGGYEPVSLPPSQQQSRVSSLEHVPVDGCANC